MIEPEDTPTLQRSQIAEQDAAEDAATTTDTTSAATIQVPVSNENTAPAPEPLPYMSIDDLLALQIVSEPQISPDGSLIAFTLQSCNGEKDTTSSAIWLVSSTGGKAELPRQVTGGEHNDIMPRWSPDGRTLAFLSDRTGAPQIYLLSMNGGEARQLSNLPNGVTAYSWRPDGSMLLAHSSWKPQDDQKSADASDIAVVYTRLDAQWDGIGYKQGRHQQLWLIPLEGDATRLTSEPVDIVQSSWSPDGTEIAFCANRRADPDLSVSMALWVLTVTNGQMRRLTPEDGLAQMPSWSPDGQSIAYLYTPDQTEAGNISPWTVQAHDATTAQLAVQGAENLTCLSWLIDELRGEFLAPPQWYPDSKALLVPLQERGQVHLARLDLEQNAIVRLTSGNGRYLGAQLSKNGQMIAMIRADWFTPGDIWVMDSAGKNPRKLTKVNDTFLRTRQLIRPKRITWQGSDGLAIEGWLYLPPLAEDAKAPLILAPHGGPTLAWGDSYNHEFQVQASRGYAILAPNPRGSAGYGEEFCRKVLNDWGGADFQDLMAGIDHVIATEPIDGTRLGIGGLSYGGYMTNWAITQTDRFKAAVSRNGISNLLTASYLSDQTIWFNLSMSDESLQKERSALTFVDRIKTPLLLLHAENDLRCPFSEAMQLFVALRKRKQPVELVRYHNVSHLMDWPGMGTPQQRLDRIRRTIEWFEHFV
ncbi:MAG TPA: S9 family peptidase [Ktedonosporobacter sp.]|jgi:dipeptidyl aminopeptidase/acylaminoacyl peptidase|nr:S9 family peptidase [Ktedonosporobacter sp.]